MDGSARVFVGTYTEENYRGRGKGIHAYSLDRGSGALGFLGLAPGMVNPSWLTLDKEGRHLYCVNETRSFQGRPSGSVSSYAVQEGGGGLRLLNVRASEGTDPCHAVLSPEGAYCLVSNYASGSLAVFPVEEDGSLGRVVQIIRSTGSGPNGTRQASAHIHSLAFDGEGELAFSCDLGSDRLRAYRFDAAARPPLSGAEDLGLAGRPGAGPRHCVFHPTQGLCYLVNELDSTISVLRHSGEKTGLVPIQEISTIPGSPGIANTAAAIRLSPDRRHVYASNRGEDSLALFDVSEADGGLAYVASFPSGGRKPRDFALDPGGAFLLAANQDSDSLVVFRVEPGTGALARVAEVEVASPTCVAMA